MFPIDISHRHISERLGHNAFYFESRLKTEDLIKAVKEDFTKFLTPDMQVYSYGDCAYKDYRIVHLMNAIGAACCSFSKKVDMNFLYPIETKWLTNTGYSVEDLVEWLDFLNNANIGMNYVFLGEQKIPDNVNVFGKMSPHVWVMVPESKGAGQNYYYLHWIMLRWLIHTGRSTARKYINPLNTGDPVTDAYTLTGGYYYNIPKLTMKFHKEYNMTPLKALFYAQMTGPYYGYYSMFYLDYILSQYNHVPVETSRTVFRPYLDISEEVFIKATRSNYGTMNHLFTPTNIANLRSWGYTGAQVMSYDVKDAMDIFQKGDERGFINYLNESFKQQRIRKRRKTSPVKVVKATSLKVPVRKVYTKSVKKTKSNARKKVGVK